MFMRTGKVAGHLRTEHRCGAGKDVYKMCVVKRFHGWSMCIGMTSASTTSWLTRQAATTCTIAITWLHLTTHSLPCTCLCLYAGFGYMSPLAAACRVHCKHLVCSQKTALTPFCHSGFSRRSCASLDSRSNGDGSVR